LPVHSSHLDKERHGNQAFQLFIFDDVHWGRPTFLQSMALPPITARTQVESLEGLYTHQVAAGVGFTLFLVEADNDKVG
jgi:hypothetical protein